MKKILALTIISLMAVTINTAIVSADSFGFYFGDDGFGINLNINDYDYYDRRSPDFYNSTGLDFRMALNPYGSWQYDVDFGGHIWIPRVSFGWRPYSNGTWTYTQYGWTWVSYEPWGWIPHHYGNWIYHHHHGWVWIPGYEWSPAQVTWGYFNGYYGWAPLPPRHCNYYQNYYGNHHHTHHHHHHWYSHTNYRNPFVVQHHDRYNDDYYYRSIPNDAWVMVNHNDFTASNISAVAISADRVPNVLSRSKFEVLDKAPDKHHVERYVGKTISRTKVDEVVKKINGQSVKVVRPVNVLENNSDQVKKVRKQYVPKQQNPNTKPRPQINRNNNHQINRNNNNHQINRNNNYNQINRNNNHNQINRNQYNQINRNRPNTVKQPAPKPRVRNPKPNVRRPAPKPRVRNPQTQIQKPNPQLQKPARKPAVNNNNPKVKKPRNKVNRPSPKPQQNNNQGTVQNQNNQGLSEN